MPTRSTTRWWLIIAVVLLIGAVIWARHWSHQAPTSRDATPMRSYQPDTRGTGAAQPIAPAAANNPQRVAQSVEALSALTEELGRVVGGDVVSAKLELSVLRDQVARAAAAREVNALLAQLTTLHGKATTQIQATIAAGAPASGMQHVQNYWDQQVIMLQAACDILACFQDGPGHSRIERDEVIDTDSEARHARGVAYDAFRLAANSATASRAAATNQPAATETAEYRPIPLVSGALVPWRTHELEKDGWFVKAYLKEIGAAYGYHVGQELVFDELLKKDPGGLRACAADHMTLVLRYMPAIESLEDRFRQLGVTPDTLKDKLLDEMRKREVPAAGDFAPIIAARAQAGYDYDAHRFLMAFHPEVVNDPAIEFGWWSTTVDTAAYPKLQGHKPTILHPASWTIQTGKNTHIAFAMADVRNQMLAMVGVRPLAPTEGILPPESLLPTLLDGAQMPNAQRDASGFTKVSGNPTMWMLSTGTRQNAGGDMYFRCLSLMAVRRGTIYNLTFRADSVLSAENAAERWRRYGPLIAAMLRVWVLD